MSRIELLFGDASPKKIASDGTFYENGKSMDQGWWESEDRFIVKVPKISSAIF